ELHRDVVRAPLLTDVVDAHHVRMIEHLGDPALVHEHPDDPGQLDVSALDRLDHHRAVLARAAREVQVGHPARGEVLDQLVLGDPLWVHGWAVWSLGVFARGPVSASTSVSTTSATERASAGR